MKWRQISNLTILLFSLILSQAFSVDYRLAPENKFPCALDDAVDAFLWLIDKNGGNVNPKNVIVMGGNIEFEICFRGFEFKRLMSIWKKIRFCWRRS